MKKVLVINLGWEQQGLIKKLSEREDCVLYGVHCDDSYEHPSRFKEVRVIDLRDIDHIIQFSDEIIPDAVVSDQCDYSLMVQAIIAERFGLLGPSVKSAQLSNNKYFQRIKSKGNDILTPEFELCVDIADIKKFSDAVGFPIIIKPVDNRGSFGVSKVNSKEEINAAFFVAIANSHSRMILAERFITGNHYIVDGAFINNTHESLAIGKKTLSNNSYMNEDILYSSKLNGMDKVIERYNDKVINKLGYDFGLTSSEYIVNNDEIYLVESTNRGGGVLISSDVVGFISGVDTMKYYISKVLGDHDVVISKTERADTLYLMYITAEKDGMLSYVNFDLLLKKDVLNFKIWVPIGGRVESELKNADSRMGVVILANNIPNKRKYISNVIRCDYE